MKRIDLIPLVMLGFLPLAIAQQLPNTGGQMQKIPVLPPVQVPNPAPTRVQPLTETQAEAKDDVAITVNALQIKGGMSFDAARLLAQTGFVSGSKLTLTQLRHMADRIADFYRQEGFFVAQVYLPPQNIQDGVVTMMVLEGVYGQVILQNESRASSESLAYFLQDMPAGSAILAAPLESQLLLMSDTPGVVVNSTLVPGKILGSSDLQVKATEGPRVNGSVDADNAGNRYTGTTRAGATLNINELLGYGDVISFRGLSSGSGLQYLRGAYQARLGKTIVGAS